VSACPLAERSSEMYIFFNSIIILLAILEILKSANAQDSLLETFEYYLLNDGNSWEYVNWHGAFDLTSEHNFVQSSR
jgi:hypothetical protein